MVARPYSEENCGETGKPYLFGSSHFAISDDFLKNTENYNHLNLSTIKNINT